MLFYFCTFSVYGGVGVGCVRVCGLCACVQVWVVCVCVGVCVRCVSVIVFEAKTRDLSEGIQIIKNFSAIVKGHVPKKNPYCLQTFRLSKIVCFLKINNKYSMEMYTKAQSLKKKDIFNLRKRSFFWHNQFLVLYVYKCQGL